MATRNRAQSARKPRVAGRPDARTPGDTDHASASTAGHHRAHVEDTEPVGTETAAPQPGTRNGPPSPVPRPPATNPPATDAAEPPPERAEPSTETDTPPSAPQVTGAPRRPGRKPVIGMLLVLIVAAAALTGYLATRPAPADTHPSVAKDGAYTPGSIPTDDGSAAVSAAARALPKALSYDYRTLDKGLTDAKPHMTRQFANTFQTTFDKTAKPMATTQRAVTNALVRGAGLTKLIDTDHAECLVYVDQILVSSETMKNNNKPAKISQNRIAVDMRREDGQWRINNISPF